MLRDLSALPVNLQTAARIDTNGEASWLDSDAEAVLHGLADSGAVVLGLDIRFYSGDGRFMEIPWSSFGPAVVVGSRTAQRPRKRWFVRRRRRPVRRGVELNAKDALDAALAMLARIDEVEVPEDTVERRILITW